MMLGLRRLTVLLLSPLARRLFPLLRKPRRARACLPACEGKFPPSLLLQGLIDYRRHRPPPPLPSYAYPCTTASCSPAPFHPRISGEDEVEVELELIGAV